jgi:hypothetical protein
MGGVLLDGPDDGLQAANPIAISKYRLNDRSIVILSPLSPT